MKKQNDIKMLEKQFAQIEKATSKNLTLEVFEQEHSRTMKAALEPGMEMQRMEDEFKKVTSKYSSLGAFGLEHSKAMKAALEPGMEMQRKIDEFKKTALNNLVHKLFDEQYSLAMKAALEPSLKMQKIMREVDQYKSISEKVILTIGKASPALSLANGFAKSVPEGAKLSECFQKATYNFQESLSTMQMCEYCSEIAKMNNTYFRYEFEQLANIYEKEQNDNFDNTKQEFTALIDTLTDKPVDNIQISVKQADFLKMYIFPFIKELIINFLVSCTMSGFNLDIINDLNTIDSHMLKDSSNQTTQNDNRMDKLRIALDDKVIVRKRDSVK